MIRSALFVSVCSAFFVAAPVSAQVTTEEVLSQQEIADRLFGEELDDTDYVEVGGIRPPCFGGCQQTTTRSAPTASSSPSPSPSRQGRAPRAPAPRTAAAAPTPVSAVPSTAPSARVRRPASPCSTTSSVALPGQLGRPVPSNVTFATGSAELRPAIREGIQGIAAMLSSAEAADKVFLVSGHADCVGSDAANLALSQRRAESVRDALIELGVPAERLQAIGFGEERRIAGEAHNSEKLRRVEVARLLSAD